MPSRARPRWPSTYGSRRLVVRAPGWSVLRLPSGRTGPTSLPDRLGVASCRHGRRSPPARGDRACHRKVEGGIGVEHCPSGSFRADGAWLGCAVLAHYVLRWIQLLGGIEDADAQCPAVARTIGARFVAMPGGLVNRSGAPMLRAPTRCPWRVLRLCPRHAAAPGAVHHLDASLRGRRSRRRFPRCAFDLRIARGSDRSRPVADHGCPRRVTRRTCWSPSLVTSNCVAIGGSRLR